MEKVSDAVVIPATFKWSDLGSWDALSAVSNQDSEGNTVSNLMCVKTHNSIIRSDDRLVTTLGIKDTVISDTKDALLVSSKILEQIKELVTELDNPRETRDQAHKVVRRPWGTYESVAMGTNYQVKRIV